LRDATGGYAVPIVVCMAIEIVAIAIILLRIGPARVVAQQPRPRTAQR